MTSLRSAVWSDHANFGRSFRRIAGISPGKYRRNMLYQDQAAQFGAI
jgi:hypothetical protein